MSRFRCFLLLQLPLLTVSALLLTGALGQQNPPANQPLPSTPPAGKAGPAAPAPPPKADPNATKALNNAIDALDSKKLGFVEMKLWEQVNTLGLTFEANGVYKSGPNERLRLEMNVRLGNTDSQLLVVSDGKWVWNQMKVGKDEPRIAKYSWSEVQKALNAPGTMPTLVEEFYRKESFRGVVPLLQNLAQQMTFTKLETVTWKNKEVYKLTAVWSPEMSKAMVAPGQPWPLFSPRTCELYLARESNNPPYWPLRVEWLGPAGQVNEDAILMAMEFRDPQIHARNSELPKQYNQAFVFDPGKAEVLDVTEFHVKQISQARNMPAPPAPVGGSKTK